MSQGKYSPFAPHHAGGYAFIFNADGEIPPDYDTTDQYDERLHLGNYDDKGFDSYGYSAFDSNGKFVGIGNGVDPEGYTEDDYARMSALEFSNL